MNDMRNLIKSSILLICMSLFLVSCDNDKEITITNRTGISLYECTVSFINKETGNFVGSERIGSLLNDESADVKKHGPFFNINARDSKGNVILSYDIRCSDEVELSVKDIRK